ncbi:DUF6414 family protein [Sphingomonas sp. RS2018]
MIRNFIYADSAKIRSISSQIFEGVSEGFISSKTTKSKEFENQSGPIGSGKLLGDIFSQSDSSTEFGFLEDFAYTLLEKRLEENECVDIVNSETSEVSVNKAFVKITAPLVINDLKHTAKTLADFNFVTEAFWRVTNEPMNWTPTVKLVADSDIKKKVAENGAYFNKKVSDAAAYILNFGYGNLIEANMTSGGYIWSGPIKRQFLRDDEDMIIHKYSRTSQSDFVMLGIVTQKGSIGDNDITIPDVADADGLKNAMRTLSRHLRQFEKTYSAPAKNEIIIDPIAIYSIL